jgi:hypothetical protein
MEKYGSRSRKSKLRSEGFVALTTRTLYTLQLALASLTGGDRPIGIVRLRTKNHGVFPLYSLNTKEYTHS